MNRQIKFVIGALFLGMVLFNSACQVDNDNFNLNNNPDDLTEISALPTTVLSPNNNPTSTEKVELGRALFWDPILSGAKEISCATCHHPRFGYADGRELSSGVDGTGLGPARRNGTLVQRNAPTILNTAFNGIDLGGDYNPTAAPMFWDNRATGLEEQALLPILSKEEMRGELIAEADMLDTVVQRLLSIPAYQTLFEAAFGNNTINENRIGEALAAFQRTLIANNSPFDEYMRGNQNALSQAEIAGMNTFVEVGCANCHNGPMFSDFELHTLSTPDHPLVSDDGATGNFDFRTPSLRNLAFTAPYMHNGVFDDLEEVLEFYDEISGGNGDSQNPNVNDNEIDNDAEDLQLNGREIREIISFLNTLNDDDFDTTIPQNVPSRLSVGGGID
ncbi:MAG: cytochrome-c peroxidase [Saprospiraceae bacterium]